MSPEIYTTPSGIAVERTHTKIPFKRGLEALLRKLDSQRGIYLSSGYEFPGRYSRWDIAALAPPLRSPREIAKSIFTPLNPRGEILNRLLEPVLAPHPHWDSFGLENGTLRGTLKPLPALFSEEQRSKQPSAFSIIRAMIAEFNHPLASRLSLVGAFGFDLLFRFDPIKLRHPRTERARSALVPLRRDLFHGSQEGTDRPLSPTILRAGEDTTSGVKRTGGTRAQAARSFRPSRLPPTMSRRSTWPTWRTCAKACASGDYYEVVLRQTFSAPYSGSHAELFGRIQKASPSPYEFFLQFGDEQLIGASPEMFVRAEGARSAVVPSPGPRAAPAMPCATRPTSENC